MQMQRRPSDPHLHCEMKVKTHEAMAAPLRSLPRSASARADPPSPFSCNPAHEPVTTPSAHAAAASSFGCMAATPTDTPPGTPKDGKATKATAPAVLSAAAFVAFWSPRRLIQRAARAFRSSRSRRRTRFDEPVAAPVVPSRLSDDSASGAGSLDVDHGRSDGNNSAAAVDDKTMQQQQHNVEVVPEKIIHVANQQAPPVVVKEACETEKTAYDEKAKENNAAATEDEEEVEEEPKKGAVADKNADVADKFCVVVKEAMMVKKHEEEEEADTKEEATRMFQGISRVKKAASMEQPPRREVARRSNDVIEEACTKLLAKRQGSRVRALVGAFETVMDAKPAAAAGKPQHHYSKSVV